LKKWGTNHGEIEIGGAEGADGVGVGRGVPSPQWGLQENVYIFELKMASFGAFLEVISLQRTTGWKICIIRPNFLIPYI